MGNRKLWTQRDGSKIRIKDMADSHLVNTVRFLERHAEQVALTIPCPQFNGEMAQFYAEQAYDQLQSDPVDTMLSGSIYDDLYEECIRRGLNAWEEDGDR